MLTKLPPSLSSEPKLHLPSVCLTALAILIGLSIFPVHAAGFHDSGVASCSGCHVMHVTEDGLPVDPNAPFGSEMELRFSSVGELCLSCHAESNGAVYSTDPLAPSAELGAGNFTFLQEDNINDAMGGIQPQIGGHRSGHSIVVPSEGLTPDPINIVGPGGSYPSSELTCTSCHDPHGNEEFRMLRGLGSTDPYGFVFLTPAPTADGIDLYFSEESKTYHTAYNAGWSDWCGNCHGTYHSEVSGASFEHPSDEPLESEFVTFYNLYNGPIEINPGDYATAYLPEVPLEDPSYTITSTTGASGTSRISCMTCHRAHGTSAVSGQRWDSGVRYLSLDGAASGSYPIPDPYSAANTRPLCVKCHTEQATQHGSGRGCTDCH